MRRRIAMVGLLVLGMAAPLVGWLYTSREVPVRLLRPPIPAADWAAYVATVDRTVEDAEVQRVIDALAAANRAEVQAHLAGRSTATDPEIAQTFARVEAAASGFVDVHGAEPYVAAGRRLAFDFWEAMAGLVEVARARGLTPEDALRLEDPEVRRYIDLGGVFVLYAARGGFIADGRLVENLRPMAHALYLDQWLRPARGRIDPATALTVAEHRWLLRWRLEWQANGRLERRIEAADALRQLSGYPADVNAGVLLYLAGRHREALGRFERAKSPEAVAYARMARRRLKEE